MSHRTKPKDKPKVITTARVKAKVPETMTDLAEPSPIGGDARLAKAESEAVESQFGTEAEPSTQELDKIDAEVEAEVISELTESQKLVAQVGTDISQAEKRLGEVDEALKIGKGDRIALMGEYIKLDAQVKSLNTKLESVKHDEFREVLLAGIQGLTCNLLPTITRLYFEMETVTTEDGTEVTKPMLRINNEVTIFGKGKKKSGAGGGAGVKVNWVQRQTGETELASVVYDRDYRGKDANVDGTADAHAWGRVIKALHSKGMALDWEQAES